MSARRRWCCALALTLVAAACGSRATAEQRATLDRVRSAGQGTVASPSTDGGTQDGALSASAPHDEAVAAGGVTDDSAARRGGQQSGSLGSTRPGETGGGATDVGVIADSVTLGNVATLSGPIPGLFQGAVVGAQAVIAYQNSLGGIAGRKLKLTARDDQFDTGQNRAQTIDLTDKVFAFLGSFSVYDDAAADRIAASGIPDASFALSARRGSIPNNFSVQPAKQKGSQLGYFNWFKQKFPEAISEVGALYPDIPAAKGTYEGFKKASESVGYVYVYERAITPTETDFTADVVRMRQQGVKMIYLGTFDGTATARLAKAMAQQNFKVQAFVGGGAAYDKNLLPLAGSAAEGIYSTQLNALYRGEDSTDIPEVALMNQWIQKVKPGFPADVYALYAWAQGRLLFKAMDAAGAELTREKVKRYLATSGPFDANGLLAPADPGRKVPPTCFLIIQVRDQKFVRVDPSRGFICDRGGYYVGD